MNAKAIGIVTARGLAILFLVNSLYLLIWAISSLMDRNMRPQNSYLVAAFTAPALYFLAAAFLWKNAESFSEPAGQPDNESLSTQNALRITLIGICSYVAFTHLGEVVNFAWDLLRPRASGEPMLFFGQLYSLGDLVTFAAAIITILVIYKGRAIVQFFSYPQREFDDPPGSDEPSD